jgi:hypothetical protein
MSSRSTRSPRARRSAGVSHARGAIRVPHGSRSCWLATLLLFATAACGNGTTDPEPDPLPPVVTSVAPGFGVAGADSLIVTVSGENFRENSQIIFETSPVPTTFLSRSQLQGTLNAEQLSLADTYQMRVRTPAPAEGESQSIVFNVVNPQPTIESLSPSFAVLHGGGFELSVYGSGFVEASQVHWNQEWLTTSFVSSEELSATVPEDLLFASEPIEVTVSNHPPGGGVSPAVPFEIRLDPVIKSFVPTGLLANDVVHDADRQVLYASIAAREAEIPNTIATIDPETAELISTIPVGIDPGPLALSSDGRFLFVGLRGEPRVQRIDLTTQSVDLQITLGEEDFFGPFYAEDLACIPGQPESVAVSRYFQGSGGSGYGGVAVFDGVVQRPGEIDRFTGANRIEPTDSPERIYGFNSRSSEYGLREILVTASGLTVGREWMGVVGGIRADIVHEDGRVYGTNGVVIDAATGVVLGNMQFDGAGPAAPDPASDRVHYLALDLSLPGGALTLHSFILSTFGLSGSAALPLAFDAPWKMVRWGSDGLAYVDGEGLNLVRTSLVTP